MAKIMAVDYEAIPGQARQMRAEGQDLNNEMVIAYRSISDMHNVWYGKRYNELVKEFNNLVPKINEMSELVVGEIPFALETIANNYSKADRGINATVANKTLPQRIENIAIINDVGMKFLTEEVTTVETNVSKNFDNAKEKMNVIDGIFNRITWQSEAADAFRARFTKLKGEIISAFEIIRNDFTKLMGQTISDIQSTESANTVE